MSNVLERIQKLLVLASGDDEEARTAAHVAAKLIREHHVTLSLPAPRAGNTGSVGTPEGYEDLAAIYNMMGVTPPWESNSQWAPDPNRRTATKQARPAPRPRAQPWTDESGGPRPRARPVEPTPPVHDPFDFVSAAEAAKRG